MANRLSTGSLRVVMSWNSCLWSRILREGERKRGGREERKEEGKERGRKERMKGGRERGRKEGREGERREGGGRKIVGNGRITTSNYELFINKSHITRICDILFLNESHITRINSHIHHFQHGANHVQDKVVVVVLNTQRSLHVFNFLLGHQLHA